MNNEIVISNHKPQDITITQDDNQLIFINGGGEVIGVTDVKVNGSSVVSNNIAYVIVPTKTSDLQNNSGFLTSETDPTVPSFVKAITRADINNWNNKQDNLVSGSNIKTINNTSLLGSGNIDIQGGGSYSAGTGIDITNGVISNTITSYNNLTDLPTIPTNTSDLINDSDFVSEDDLSEVAFTGSYGSLSDTPIIPDSTSDLINNSGFIDNTVNNLTNYTTTTDLNTLLGGKQDTLVSGTNIKTINNNSLLGSGNITISGGTPTDVQVNGTSITSGGVANLITNGTYNSSTNKIATMSDIPTNTSDLTNDSGYINKNVNDLTYYTLSSNLSSVATSGNYNDLSNTPTIPTATSQLTNTGADGTHPYIPALDSGLKGLGVTSGRLFWEYGPALTDTTLANYSDLTGKQDTLVSGTNIKTINNNSLLGSGNIKITFQDVLSTSETLVGTWIDGKPLYRITITGLGTGSNPHNLQNLDSFMIDSSHSFIKKVTGRSFPIGYCAFQNSDFAGISVSTTDIQVAGTIPNFSSATVTLLYTKTTD